jgi:hypothetical protein
MELLVEGVRVVAQVGIVERGSSTRIELLSVHEVVACLFQSAIEGGEQPTSRLAISGPIPSEFDRRVRIKAPEGYAAKVRDARWRVVRPLRAKRLLQHYARAQALSRQAHLLAVVCPKPPVRFDKVPHFVCRTKEEPPERSVRFRRGSMADEPPHVIRDRMAVEDPNYRVSAG